MLDVVNDFLSDIAAGDSLNTESRRSINLKHERAATGAHQINTSNVQTHGLGGLDGDTLFLVGELDTSSLTTLVEIATKIVVERLALHAGDHAGANHEGTDVHAGGFFDVFLKQNVRSLFVIEVESLESGLGGFFGLGQNDAVTMSARGELDDDWETDLFQKVVKIGGIARNEGFRSIDASFSEDLLRAQFVTSTSDGDGARGYPSALHLKLANNGTAVAGHIIRNTGDDSVKTRESFAVIVDIGMLVVERKVAILVFDDANLETTLLGLGNEALGRIIGIAIRKNCDIHNENIVPRKVGYVNMI